MDFLTRKYIWSGSFIYLALLYSLFLFLALHIRKMAQDELEYLKSLVSQLNDKIASLEAKAKTAVTPTKTPAQQLRTILVGPPGAGAYFRPFEIYISLTLILQAREHRRLKSVTSFAYATWQLVTCCVSKFSRRHLSESRPRRSWTPEDSSQMRLWSE